MRIGMTAVLAAARAARPGFVPAEAESETRWPMTRLWPRPA
jgi:hypothetical protein